MFLMGGVQKACKEGELGEHGRSMPFSSGPGAEGSVLSSTGHWYMENQ